MNESASELASETSTPKPAATIAATIAATDVASKSKNSAKNSTNPWRGLSRRSMEKATVGFLHQGRNCQSTIRVLETEGQRAVAKDYARTPPFFRRYVAPFLLNREERALRFLAGTIGVPQVFARVDRQALIIELIEGKPIDHFQNGELGAEVFARVQETIDRIHARGVAHGDLKRRGNLMVTPRGEIFLIDFAASLIGKRPLRPVVNWLQREVARVDNKCVPRLKMKAAPELMTDDDRRKLETPTKLERWARRWLNR